MQLYLSLSTIEHLSNYDQQVFKRVIKFLVFQKLHLIVDQIWWHRTQSYALHITIATEYLWTIVKGSISLIPHCLLNFIDTNYYYL